MPWCPITFIFKTVVHKVILKVHRFHLPSKKTCIWKVQEIPLRIKDIPIKGMFLKVWDNPMQDIPTQDIH